MTPIPAPNAWKDWAEPVEPDPAKASVMAEIERLAAAGLAVSADLDGRTLGIRLVTGEVFLFGEKTVTRIA
jgi:hypothetical protein